jgi:hypothetical protein
MILFFSTKKEGFVNPDVINAGAIAFEHHNAQGRAILLLPGRYNVRDLEARGMRNDTISYSIRV